MPTGVYKRRSLEERFWEKVDKNGPIPDHCPELGPCWVWTGIISSTGYGVLGVNKRTIKTHRVSYEFVNGPIPEGPGFHGTCVLHKCDNRICVNPEHLFIGSINDNVLDKIQKGRQSK